MTKLLFNEDLNHFLFTRLLNGVEVDEKEILSFIDQYADSGITDFIINVSDSKAWYPSKRGENVLDLYENLLKTGRITEDDEAVTARCLKLLHDIYRVKKLDMHTMWIDRLRTHSIRPWISIRVNDIHDYGNKDHIFHSEFFRTQENIRRGDHRPYGNTYDNAFDFMDERVRNVCMELVIDALETFDMYGLELDWMREIYSIRIGRELEGQAVLNTFMGQVYDEVKKAEKRWNHPIKIAVRLPSSPQKTLALGVDFFTWVEKHYVDVITVTPRWSSMDNLMPMDVWKGILKNTGVTLAAGSEVLIDSYNRPNRVYIYNSLETVIGTAAGYYGMGADAFYLFNYMDPIKGQNLYDTFPLCSDPVLYSKLLRTVADPDLCYEAKRRHVVTFNDVFAPGVYEVAPLPMLVNKNTNSEAIDYKYLRIPTGRIPKNLKPSFVIGVEKGYKLDDTLLVYANSIKLTLSGRTEMSMPFNNNFDYYEYDIPNNGELPYITVLEIGATSTNCVIHWAEIRLV